MDSNPRRQALPVSPLERCDGWAPQPAQESCRTPWSGRQEEARPEKEVKSILLAAILVLLRQRQHTTEVEMTRHGLTLMRKGSGSLIRSTSSSPVRLTLSVASVLIWYGRSRVLTNQARPPPSPCSYFEGPSFPVLFITHSHRNSEGARPRVPRRLSPAAHKRTGSN